MTVLATGSVLLVLTDADMGMGTTVSVMRVVIARVAVVGKTLVSSL